MSRKGLLLAASALAVLAVAILSVREIRRRQALADLPDVPTANVPASIVRALTPLRAAVVEQPRSGSAWGVYGMALYANEFFGPAAPCFARAEELNGGDARWPHLWSLCQFGEARRLRGAALRRALAADPGQAASAAALAEVLLEDDATAEAERVVDAARIRAPANARLAFLRARLDVRAGRFEDAVKLCEPLLRAYPGRRDVRQLAVQAFQGAGRKSDVAVQVKALAALDKAPPDVFWEDPLVAAAGRFREGPDWRVVLALRAVRRGDFASAVAELEKLAPEELKPLKLRILLASARAQVGANPEGEKDLRALIQEDPAEPSACFELGNLLLARGRHADAAASFEESLRRRPNSDSALFNLGVCYVNLKRESDAIAAFSAAFKANPLNLAAARELAAGLLQTGKKVDARGILADALLFGPDDSQLVALRKLVETN